MTCRLRCLVVIDLKIGKLTHGDIGQMHMSLNYAKEHWTRKDENPPVGLILRAEKDKAVAHDSLERLPNKMLTAELEKSQRAVEFKAITSDSLQKKITAGRTKRKQAYELNERFYRARLNLQSEIKMTRKKAAPAKEPPQTIKFDAAKKPKLLAKNSAQLVEYAAAALITAKQLGIKTRPLKHFTLPPAQREVLLAIPDISTSIKTKLMKAALMKVTASFTVAEVISMTMALADAPTEGDAKEQLAIALVAEHLMERLQEGINEFAESKLSKAKVSKTKANPNAVFQFKITLIESKPPIWRRIQVENCTLDQFHEHIQTAMGWTNSHLHRFEIGDKRYADPLLMEEDMEEFGYIDSTRTNISKIVPKTGKRFSFTYEYDFGDDWEHEIMFEGCPRKESGKKYPLCLEGEQACPPEDVGGISGFYEFLEALADPEHEDHDDMLRWRGKFDSKMFDAKLATRAMKKGLPDWRE